MAKNKSKKGGKKSSKPEEQQVKAEKVEKVEAVKTEEVKAEKEEKVTKVIASEEKSGNPFKGFFAAKHDKSENILTIFKTPRIWGALIGEIVGTMFLAMFFLLLGVYPLYMMFAFIAVIGITYKLSGAHLNPLITAGMMASQRVSAIRGVLYILAQVLGAWLGLLIVNGFRLAGDGTVELPAMAAVADDQFWIVSLIELVGAALLGYVFARAWAMKKKPSAFILTAGIGTAVVYLFMVVISSNYLGLSNNFLLNPAVSLMYQILPTTGESFGELFGATMLALCTYVIFPMVGGIVGFAVSDIAAKLSGENECCDCHKCECKK